MVMAIKARMTHAADMQPANSAVLLLPEVADRKVVYVFSTIV